MKLWFASAGLLSIFFPQSALLADDGKLVVPSTIESVSAEVRPAQSTASPTVPAVMPANAVALAPADQPTKTQPATTQPTTTQPATTQPATTQPATTQPATTQPATTQPAAQKVAIPLLVTAAPPTETQLTAVSLESSAAPEARECYQRAAAALVAKNVEVASAELGRLVELYPSDELAPLAAMRLAECWLSAGDAAAATELLKSWTPKLAQSPRTLALEPTALLRAHYIGARAHFAASRFDEVIDVAREQIDLLARRSSLSTAESLLQSQFRELSDQASKRREQAVGVQLRAAAEQVRAKRFSEAVCTLEQCEPEELSAAWRWRYHVLHAQCVAAQGDAPRALKEFDEIALSQLSEAERTAVHMACLEAAVTGQLVDRAQVELTALGPAAASDEQLGVTIALRSVEVAMFRKDRVTARRLAAEAKQKYPKFVGLYEFDLLLARNALAQVEFDEARRLLQSIIHNPPASDATAVPRAQWWLGESYFLSQDYPRAMVAYTAVIDSNSVAAWADTALMQRGKCHESLNDPTSATADYQRLLEQFPDSPVCAQARTRLNELSSPASSMPIADPIRSAARPPLTISK